MPRRPKPWWRKDRQSWFVTIDGTRHNLGPSREAAFRRFHELMAAPKAALPPATDEDVTVVIDAFLDWTQRHRAESTYHWYLQRCQSFVLTIPGLRVSRLRPFHVQEWVDANAAWSNGHKRGCITAVQRALRWAEQMGRIERNPIAFIEKPAPGKRDHVISATEYADILARCDDAFADLVTTAWETGARPQELLRVEGRHVDLDNARWVFPPAEAKVKTRPRIVYLSDEALPITKRLMVRSPEGPLFRNCAGDPWTPMAINCRFNRLRFAIGRDRMRQLGVDVPERAVTALARTLPSTKRVRGELKERSESEIRCDARRRLRVKLAAEHASKLCLYLFRHAFATRLLQAGVDALTVAILLGHSNPAMLSTTYQHLSHNPQHLADQLRRAAG